MYVCAVSFPTIFYCLSQCEYVSHVRYMREVIKIIFSFTFYNNNTLDALTLFLHFGNYF